MSRSMQLLGDLEQTRQETLRYFDLGEPDLARTYAVGKWPVRFILHHLADSETVMYERIRRIISEPRQVLWVYDQDAWADKLDYARLPIALSLRVYDAARSAVIHLVRQHYDASGHLEFVHSVTGVRTLADECSKVAAHNAHHLRQIRQALL